MILSGCWWRCKWHGGRVQGRATTADQPATHPCCTSPSDHSCGAHWRGGAHLRSSPTCAKPV